MKRNLWKFSFGLLGFFILFSIFSCNNIISPKKATQVSFNLDISGLQETHQNQANFLNSRVAEDSISHISVSLYQVTDSASVSENQELDTSKLPLLESITPSVAPDGKVLATFNEVTVGIDAVIFVEIYELTDANEKILAYKGNSPVFPVREGENNVKVDLEKVQNQEVKQEFTVTFDTNGGNFADGKATSLTVTSGETVTLTDYVPTKSGFNFGGWYFDEGLQKGADSRVIPNKDNTTSGTLTLYAKWEAVSISINQTVTSFSALQTAITNASGTSQDNPYVIGIGANFSTADTAETIAVSQHIKLVATGDYTITKTTDFAGINIFTVNGGASLTLGDANAGGTLTIDGGGTAVPSSRSLINVSGSLTLNEKSVLQNSYITSSTHGGAVYSSGGTISINGGILEANKLEVTQKNGGAIYLENGTFTVTSGSFITNSASPTTGNQIYGGALYIHNSVVSIQNAHFDGNSVSATDTGCYGGAIYIINSGTESASVTISNCSFTNNSAYQRGGAIYTSGESYIEINNCSFENNSITNSTGQGSDVYVGNTSGSTKIDGTQVTGGWTSN